MDNWVVIWGSLAALFVIVEVLSVNFVAIYFALGAMSAAIVAGLGGNVALQMLAFSATAIALMVMTRPVLKRKLEPPTIETNVNRLVGKGGIVTIAIDNDANTGQIRVGTEYWTARSTAPDPAPMIPVDARVSVESVEGVTARVRLREAAPTVEA
jgi:membrane protein implicated in regulation of membrane protease activity